MSEKTEHHSKPSITCDVVAINSHLAKFREDGSFINIVLIKRKATAEAFPNAWALPGGFLEEGETLEECAVRELKEETGLDAKLLAPVGVFAKAGRDPRGWVISNAFMTMLISTDESQLPIKAADDAAEVAIFNIKGTFNNPDGTSLTLRLRCPENSQRIVFTTTFSRQKYGVIEASVEYDEKESTTKLAFDHAEMISRAVLRAPDIIKTSNKFVASPVVHAEPAADSDEAMKRKLKEHLQG